MVGQAACIHTMLFTPRTVLAGNRRDDVSQGGHKPASIVSSSFSKRDAQYTLQGHWPACGPFHSHCLHADFHDSKPCSAGEFQAGMRAGKGIMLLPDGGVYTGEFSADTWEGTGMYEYPDGSCYVGEWKQGKKHGSGADSSTRLQTRILPGLINQGRASVQLEAGIWRAGTYWDKHGGCLAGTWAAGIVTGTASYKHPAYSMQASFTKGIPDGNCTFESTAFRKLDSSLPHTSAANIRSPAGPVLTHSGTYSIPELSLIHISEPTRPY